MNCQFPREAQTISHGAKDATEPGTETVTISYFSQQLAIQL